MSLRSCSCCYRIDYSCSVVFQFWKFVMWNQITIRANADFTIICLTEIRRVRKRREKIWSVQIDHWAYACEVYLRRTPDLAYARFVFFWKKIGYRYTLLGGTGTITHSRASSLSTLTSCLSKCDFQVLGPVRPGWIIELCFQGSRFFPVASDHSLLALLSLFNCSGSGSCHQFTARYLSYGSRCWQCTQARIMILERIHSFSTCNHTRPVLEISRADIAPISQLRLVINHFIFRDSENIDRSDHPAKNLSTVDS